MFNLKNSKMNQEKSKVENFEIKKTISELEITIEKLDSSDLASVSAMAGGYGTNISNCCCCCCCC